MQANMDALEGEAPPETHTVDPQPKEKSADVNCNDEKENDATDAIPMQINQNKTNQLDEDNTVEEPMEIDLPEDESHDGPPILERQSPILTKSIERNLLQTKPDDLEVNPLCSEPEGRDEVDHLTEKQNEHEDNLKVKSPLTRKRKISELKALEDGPPAKDKPHELHDEKTTNDLQAPDLSADLNLPPKQLLGKGKRARIPNKRYSDFPLTPSRHHDPDEEGKLIKGSENGETKEMPNIVGEKIEEPTPTTPIPTVTALKGRGSQGNSPASSRKKPVDINSPQFLKPLNDGWKREFVYRASGDSSLKRTGDIYYYTPTGKKLRSLREISENLKGFDLTLDNFTFFKDSLGLDDPEKEIIREAKGKNSLSASTRKTSRFSKTPKTIASPKSASKVDKLETPTETPKGKTSRGSFKVKIAQRPKPRSQRLIERTKKTDEPENPYAPVYKTSAKKQLKTPGASANISLEMVERKPCRPCSIRCVGVAIPIPTLQCRHCLCLYHRECVGLPPHYSSLEYVCKNCQMEPATTTTSIVQPPPLTPINTLKSITTQVTSLPKLQRIPRVDEEKESLNTPPVPPTLKLNNIENEQSESNDSSNTNATESKSVGSVTWFPSSSTIQQADEVKTTEIETTAAHPMRPQFVELIGNKKYLVIPKHHVMSVSPSIAATASTPAPHPHPDTYHDPMKIAAESCEPPTTTPDCASLGRDSHEAAPPTECATASTELLANKTTPKVGKLMDPTKSPFMENYLQNVAYGYNTLLYVFQYLKMQDLLSASCVCTMWRDIASHPALWRTVRMKNSQIHSFTGLADALEKHGTVHLDLRKMLLPNNGGDEIWGQFSRAIKKVTSLRKIELCRCPAVVIEQLPLSNPKLEVINAVAIKCEKIGLSPLVFLTELQELRLKSTSGFTLKSDLNALSELKNLRHLSLTSVKELNKQNIEVISDLRNLESLDLGECTDFPKNFGSEILTRLNKLEKLRLEKGQGNCHTFEILDAVKDMTNLEQLELVNFDIKPGFDKALGECKNIKKLLIIPTYISQSATTNHMVLGGVLRLHPTLSHFVWGVTLELLRVTELFVDQCEDPEKKEKKDKRTPGTNESIPVLKPVPLLVNGRNEIPPPQDPPQVEILPLPNLQKLLLQSLPTTRVKILKIPFHATWRQTVTDV